MASGAETADPNDKVYVGGARLEALCGVTVAIVLAAVGYAVRVGGETDPGLYPIEGSVWKAVI